MLARSGAGDIEKAPFGFVDTVKFGFVVGDPLKRSFANHYVDVYVTRIGGVGGGLLAAPHTIDAAMCERFVNAASHSCTVSAQPARAVQEPHWDALANSFASLSAAFAWGTLFLALVAVLAAIGWGFLVRHWAEREAKQEAAECVNRLMDKWLAEEAPQLVRKHVELLQNASLGADDDEVAADQMGKEAG